MKLCLVLFAALTLTACNSLSDVTSNPNCVTRVTIKGSYGAGLPTGTYSAGALCGAAKPKGLDAIPPAPPTEDKPPTA